VTETPPEDDPRTDEPEVEAPTTPEEPAEAEAPVADAAEAPAEVDAPPAPPEAEAAGDAGEASKADVAEDERPAPPARAKDPDVSEGAAPETQPLGQGEPVAGLEEVLEDTPRVKPEIPGADLVPDIVLDGADEVPGEEGEDAEDGAAPTSADDADRAEATPIAEAAIDLAAGARYPSQGYVTGKRKSSIARVYLRPGAGDFHITGSDRKRIRTLDQYFPRLTLRRTIREPLETVGYEAQMDVVAKIRGGGTASQADALRHGIARALLEADPNLRGELKRRGFLTRDARVKERKKAGLKKARKRPQFSKR
jgi:small subunit ribosomal protein S9